MQISKQEFNHLIFDIVAIKLQEEWYTYCRFISFKSLFLPLVEFKH